MVEEEQPVLGPPPPLPDGLWDSMLQSAFVAPVPADLDELIPAEEAFGETLDDGGWADAGAFSDDAAPDAENDAGAFGAHGASGHDGHAFGDWSEESHGAFSDHQDDAGSSGADF